MASSARRVAQLIFFPGFSTIQDSSTSKPGTNLDRLIVLLNQQQIAKKVAELGAQITRDFQGESVVLGGVLKGATILLADLAREIKLDATFDFIAVSSYGNSREQSGEVKLMKDVDQSMDGKNIILVEDILDTGLTLTYLKAMLLAHKPKSLKIAALLDKVSRRQMLITGDYVGVEIADGLAVA